MSDWKTPRATGVRWVAPRLGWFCALLGAAGTLVYGCGGTTITHESTSGDGRDGGGGANGSNPPDYATGGRKGACGNGMLESNEECDGKLFRTPLTCSSASMGQYSGGTLRCTSKCTMDMSGCTRSVGTGGTFGGTGGFRGNGGAPGYAGSPVYVEAGLVPPECPPGSAPDPTNPYFCNATNRGVNACLAWTNMELPYAPRGAGCGVNCGCGQCPTDLGNCLADPQCTAILQCVVSRGCYGTKACSPACDSVVYANGGYGGPAITKAIRYDECFQSYGCSACPGDGGVYLDAAFARRGAQSR